LEGDQPHAVSVWFNSSNLEANVSNTCVFSISDQEKLDSVNLDLQSNTWHNLTYAYQGEGGSRVTYLDGRKVAEDQAEDTFGEYPPFAMTGYAQGGYVVSASTQYNAGGLYLLSWNAFDNTTGTRWDTANDANYNSSGVHDGSFTTSVGGVATNGEWIQVEFPHKLRPSYFTLHTNIGTSPDNYQQRAPKTVLLVGSNTNNGTDWVSLFNNTSNPRASEPSTTLVEPFVVSSTASYKYLRLIVLKTFGGEGLSASISELKFYGHRENDLVRLPDPTNVLKYPHIAMTGPAQRGYVVTESSYAQYNINLGFGWKAFDSTRSSSSSEFSWQTVSSTYSSGNARTGVAIETIPENSNTHVGSWVTLETPHKIQVSSVELTCPVGIDEYRPNSVVILGGDNNSTWNFLKGDISSTYTNDIRTITITSSVAYKYHMLLVKTTGSASAGYATTTFLSDIRYYGTEEGSVPIQIGGGNIDKVANFRVYDTFVGEDQALEIWDAQKDYFGRAKSSMTLQKGRLGLGTTEPQGRLAVLDEPHNLEEFPPRAMTGYKNYFEGHGVFCASVSAPTTLGAMTQAEALAANASNGSLSSTVRMFYRLNSGIADSASNGGIRYYASADLTNFTETQYHAYGILNAGAFPNATQVWIKRVTSTTYEAIGQKEPQSIELVGQEAYNLFNKNTTLTDYWESAANTYTSTSGGSPAVSTSGSKRLASNEPYGSWVTLKLPYEICLKSYEFTGPGTKSPKEGQIWGSTNGTTWSHVHTFTGGVADVKNNETVSGNTNYYSYYAFITTKITGADTVVRIVEWRLFGTREQGQSVLHDGQLTLTKSLNVPRIGPPLDADDTPRRDRLVVEYNTSTNPTFEGAVRDTSGRGNDGVMVGSSYSATDKSLSSSGTTGEIRLGSLPTTTITQLSFSFWINPTGNSPLLYHGYEATGRRISFSVDQSGVGLFFAISGNYIQNAACLTLGQWQHVSVVFSGGSIGSSLSDGSAVYKLYIDGVDKGWTGGSFNAGILQLENGHPFVLMNGVAGTTGTGVIKLSNFKYYDTALTAEEVKTLYDMGRCDEGHHVVNFSKTRVGIGLGDGEAPRAALDVRGDILGGNPAAFSVAYNPTSLSGNQTIIWNLVYHNVGGAYDSSNGLFTAPVSGYYHFTVWGMTSGTTSGVIELQFQKNGSSVQQRPYSQGVNNYGHVSGTIIEYLSVGDTMKVFLTTSTTLYAASAQSYNGFSGFYLSS